MPARSSTARQSDSRVEVTLDSGAMGARGGAVGASTGAHEAVGSATAARALAEGGCRGRSAPSTARSSTRCRASMRRTNWRSTAPSSRSTARQTKDGSAPIAVLGVAGLRQGVGHRTRPAAFSLCRRGLCPHPPGADDEHRQWRVHADNPIDIQEFMIVPVARPM